MWFDEQVAAGLLRTLAGEGTAEAEVVNNTKPPARVAQVVAPSHPYDRVGGTRQLAFIVLPVARVMMHPQAW